MKRGLNVGGEEGEVSMLGNDFLHYDKNIKKKNHNTNKYNEIDRIMC